MNAPKRYTIPYKGLKSGSHYFDFEVDDLFFREWEGSGIEQGHATVNVELQKAASTLLLLINIDGHVTVECDRCLDDLSVPVHYEGELKVKFAEQAGEDDGDGEMMWIDPAESEIDLSQYIYDSIMLSLPYRRIHGEDADGRSLCNEDMLARFRIVDSAEFEAIEARQTAASLSGTPEAEKLKALKDKMITRKK